MPLRLLSRRYRVIGVLGFELFFASHSQYKIICVGPSANASFHVPSHEFHIFFFVHCHTTFESLGDTNIIFDAILSYQLFRTIYWLNRLQLNTYAITVPPYIFLILLNQKQVQLEIISLTNRFYSIDILPSVGKLGCNFSLRFGQSNFLVLRLSLFFTVPPSTLVPLLRWKLFQTKLSRLY